MEKRKAAKNLSAAALIILGVLCFFNVVRPGQLLATIIYPEYFWYHLYPDSTDPASPTLLSAGSQVTLDIELVYYDATSGVELPPPTYWIVKAAIIRLSDSTVVQTIDFGKRDSTEGGVQVDSHFCSIAVWSQQWTVPTGLGIQYMFNWTVQIKDSTGVDYGTQTTTTYAKTADVEPDGVFKINGKDASQTSALVVLSPTLQLEFSPIKNSEKVNNVNVQVWKGGSQASTVQLSKQTSGSYTGSYTLPGYGTYELRGIIEWTEGTPIRKMSLVVDWGEEGGGWFGMNQIIGLICIGGGSLLLVVTNKRR